MLELKDLITFSATGVSLVLSATALWFSQFRKARISTRIGPDVHLYYDANRASGIYLPVTFSNTAPVRGAILKAYLVVLTPAGEYFSLRWLDSASIKYPEMEYSFISRAKPFSVDGHSSASDVFLFVHPRHKNIPALDFVAGTYRMRLQVWTENRTRPQMHSEEKLVIGSEGADALRANFESGINNTRYFYFENRGNISLSTGKIAPDFGSINTD